MPPASTAPSAANSSVSPSAAKSSVKAELGDEMEARVAQVWFWEGYFSRRAISLERHFHPEPLTVTDLDLVAFGFSPHLTRTKYIGEIKAGTGKGAPRPLDRLIWLRGLRELVGADSCELTTAIQPSDRVRELARTLGMVAQSVADLERREQEAVGARSDMGSHGVSALAIIRQVQEICKRDPELERAFWFLRSEVWFLDTFVSIKQTIELLQRLARRFTPKLDDEDGYAIRWLMAEAVSIFTLNVVTIAGLSLTLDKDKFTVLVSDKLAEGLIPTHQARRFSESVDKYVMGLLAAANAPTELRVNALGAFLPEPPAYAESFAELAWRLGRSPLQARSLPRQIDLLGFERLVRRREVHHAAATRLGLIRGEGAKLRRYIAAFLRGTNASVEVLDAALTKDVVLKDRRDNRAIQPSLLADSETEVEPR